MADFVDKKEKLADMIEAFIVDNSKGDDLLVYVNELSNDSDFRGKDLFHNIFNELSNYLLDLSSKELKQRVLMIRSFLD